MSYDETEQDVPPSGPQTTSLRRVTRLPGGGSISEPVQPTPASTLDALQIPRPYWQRLDVAELSNWRCEPLRPIIDGILARGNLACIVAETQTGKTLLGVLTPRSVSD